MVSWVTDGAPGCLRIDASLLQSSASVDTGSQTSGAAVSNLLPSKSTELSGVGGQIYTEKVDKSLDTFDKIGDGFSIPAVPRVIPAFDIEAGRLFRWGNNAGWQCGVIKREGKITFSHLSQS